MQGLKAGKQQGMRQMLFSVCRVIRFLCSMEVLAPVGFGWAEARLGLAGAGGILG